MLSRLSKISSEYNICILMTNQVQADPGAQLMFASASSAKVQPADAASLLILV